MRKIVIRADKGGEFHWANFGRDSVGEDGQAKFELAIEAPGLQITFPEVCAHDLFPKVELNSVEFRENRAVKYSFLTVKESDTEILVEAHSGTLYDFLKERGANEGCTVRAKKTVAFYWAGREEAA